jgi:hypothetical protein
VARMRTALRPAVLSCVMFSGCAGGQVAPVASSSGPAGVGAPAAEPHGTSRDSASPEDGGALKGAQLAPAAPEVDGGHVASRIREPGRSSEDIRAIVVAHRDEARACYDKSLVAHPGIEGDLVIRWTIDPKGAVTQVTNDTARSQILEPSVVSCIGEVLTKIQFAPSQRGFETRALYPFNFHPRHASPASAP